MDSCLLSRKFSQLTIITVTLLLLSESAWSFDQENDPIKELTKPKSTINFGAGYLVNDNARFGQYTGLRNDGFYGIFDVNIIRRNNETGTWLKLLGRNLGLPNRDVRFEHYKQGNWGYFIDFSQTPRFEPFTVNTAVTGIGTADLHVPTTPTAGDSVQL